jgi:hypothetical protein
MGLTGNPGSSQHDSQAKRTQGKTGGDRSMDGSRPVNLHDVGIQSVKNQNEPSVFVNDNDSDLHSQ